MLATARLQGCLRESLLMRIFVETGIATREIEKITAEAVAAGYFRTDSGVICFSRELKNGLNEYVRQRGIQSGPCFSDERQQTRQTAKIYAWASSALPATPGWIRKKQRRAACSGCTADINPRRWPPSDAPQ